jgi:hypothetical protein
MSNNDLLKQADQLLTYYSPDSDPYRVLRAVIDGSSRGKISDVDMEAASRLRDELPTSTISLMLQKILTGSTDALTTESLARWIAATGAERKKR